MKNLIFFSQSFVCSLSLYLFCTHKSKSIWPHMVPWKLINFVPATLLSLFEPLLIDKARQHNCNNITASASNIRDLNGNGEGDKNFEPPLRDCFPLGFRHHDGSSGHYRRYDDGALPWPGWMLSCHLSLRLPASGMLINYLVPSYSHFIKPSFVHPDPNFSKLIFLRRHHKLNFLNRFFFISLTVLIEQGNIYIFPLFSLSHERVHSYQLHAWACFFF